MTSRQEARVSGADVAVRAFRREDIIPLVDYLTGSTEEFWRVRGVDKAKLLPRGESIENYEKRFREQGRVPTIVTIELRGVAIGVHTLTHLVQGSSAVFHAHIWREEHRRLGIGVFSYLKAAELFFSELQLEKLLFKTPKLNAGAHRVKEKIGIPPLGDIVFDAPVLISPLPATLYELSPALLAELKKRHGI